VGGLRLDLFNERWWAVTSKIMNNTWEILTSRETMSLCERVLLHSFRDFKICSTIRVT